MFGDDRLVHLITDSACLGHHDCPGFGSASMNSGRIDMSVESTKRRGALTYLLLGGALIAIVTALTFLGRESNEAWRTSVFLFLAGAVLALVASLAVFT